MFITNDYKYSLFIEKKVKTTLNAYQIMYEYDSYFVVMDDIIAQVSNKESKEYSDLTP